MKTTLRITAFTLVAAATVLVMSCALAPVSISDTVSSFINSLNGDRSDTYKSTSTSATDYAAARISAFWGIPFPLGAKPYSYSGLNDSNPAAVTLTITANSVAGSYTFIMVNDKNMGSDNWLIKQITGPPGSTVWFS